jgi:hypothetical protein
MSVAFSGVFSIGIMYSHVGGENTGWDFTPFDFHEVADE